MPLTTATAPRSCLCVPADDERKTLRALSGPADQVVLDLEDAVPADRKDLAREGAVAAAARAPERDIVVRINGLDTAWWREDITAVVTRMPTVRGVVVPKSERLDDLLALERQLTALEDGTRRPVDVQLLIESARGLSDVDTLLGGSARTTAVVIGYADLGVSLRRPVGPPAAATWLAVQHQVLLAARTHGVYAIDGPWFDFRDEVACSAANAHAVASGFDAKWVIHPGQIDAVNAAFRPHEAAVRRARRMIEAFEGAAGAVVAVDGTMVDKPVVDAARLVLAAHDDTRNAR